MQSTKGKPTYVWLFLIGLIAIELAVTTGDDVPATPRNCLQCKSDANIDCLDQTKIQPSACPDKVTKCYTSRANGVITRGCYDDGNKPCVVGDDCRTCDSGDGCNKEAICKTCDSSDKDCSQSDVSDTKYNSICKTADNRCFINVKDKKVERRCAVDGDGCSDSTTCKLCTGVNCNAGIFPDNRRQCFQCTDSKCDAAGSSKDNSKPCLNFVADDKCYSTGTSAETMTRGCMSDVDPKPCSQETDKGCDTCGENGCNSLTYKRDAKMQCIKCNTETEADCAAQAEAEKAKACTEQLLYNQTESCYTLAKGSSVRRGCLFDDAKEECDDKDACKICNDKNGCNNQKVDITFTCIVCRSDADKDCWNKAKNIGGHGCRTSVSSKEEGCFHGIWNGIAIRGCYVDADERMKVTCKEANNKQCKLCYEKDCNTKNSSGAGSIIASISLLSVILATLWYLK